VTVSPYEQRLGVWWIAEDHPDLTAIASSPSACELTFGELAARAHRAAHLLRARGLVPGDVVAYALPNDVDTVVWQLAATESGLRYVLLNPALSTAEISGIVEHSNASGLVVHAELAGAVTITDFPSIPVRLAVGGPIDGFESAAGALAGQPATPPDERSLGGGFSYSSGTTGTPKGIWRRLPDVDPAEFADVSKTFGQAFAFEPLAGAHLVSAGMHHGGCAGFYLGALNVGQALVIMGKFDPEQALRLIERHRVASAYMVPTHFVRLLRLPDDVRRRYDHSSLRSVVHSAAPCPREIKAQMLDWWGPVIWETYGGMEGAATIAKPHRWLEKPGTVGRAVRGMKVMILDDDGNELPPGGVGNVYMESALGGFRYHNDREATEQARRGRAFTIGDIGYLDDDGYLFLCDRARDIIISGGVNVYPAEVEGVLVGHPAVGDVAVIGVPDPEWGEQVKAVVELVDRAQATPALADELISYCRERLSGYKCPRSVEFEQGLPRTDTGKLYKRRIRERYWSESGRSL